MTYAFSTFRLDDTSLELTRDGRPVRLERQPARALALLVSRPGDVVTRDELRQAIWGTETHVDYDRGLAYCIGQVRTALGDSADQPRFVQTLPKRGFRFIAPVSVVNGLAGNGVALGPAGAAGAASNGAAPAAAEADAVAASDPGPPPGPAAARVSRRPWIWALAGALAVIAALAAWRLVDARRPVVVAVSIFDNETGDASFDGFVTGLSDVVVTHLTALAPARLGVVGNDAALRQPRNIRNLRALGAALDADYVVLGQLQRDDGRLRFIVHFIRLEDEVHLRANRFVRPASDLHGFEGDVIAEVERVVRTHVLGGS
jgi:DNA-binding winged helix-turn-helix (wHTH) protein/TolB-like protein